MRGNLVYLAGPISGCGYGECTDWRQVATDVLELEGAHCLSPMRAKAYLESEEVIDGSYEEHVLSSARGIMTRDFFDCRTADILLVNLRGAPRVSIGTVMEIAWAFDNGVPVVCVMEEGNIHTHPMINEAIGFRVNTIDEAIDVVRTVLDLR